MPEKKLMMSIVKVDDVRERKLMMSERGEREMVPEEKPDERRKEGRAARNDGRGFERRKGRGTRTFWHFMQTSQNFSVKCFLQ
jgi:hypothetical protein